MSMRLRRLRDVGGASDVVEHAKQHVERVGLAFFVAVFRSGLVELVVDKRLQAGFEACDLVDGSADVHIASALSIGEPRR